MMLQGNLQSLLGDVAQFKLSMPSSKKKKSKKGGKRGPSASVKFALVLRSNKDIIGTLGDLNLQRSQPMITCSEIERFMLTVG